LFWIEKPTSKWKIFWYNLTGENGKPGNLCKFVFLLYVLNLEPLNTFIFYITQIASKRPQIADIRDCGFWRNRERER
jgi:hypothetical protein